MSQAPSPWNYTEDAKVCTSQVDASCSARLGPVKVKVIQSCLIFCDPMVCTCTVRGILQARILKWVAFPFSRESSQPRNWTWASHIAGRLFTVWAPRLQGKPLGSLHATINPSLTQRPLISQKLNHIWSSSCKGLFNFLAFYMQEGWHFLVILLAALFLTVFQTVPRTWNINVCWRKETGS